jgi:hypothetical protein
MRLPDVNKALEYLDKKSGWQLRSAFELINKEIANDGKTFSNPEVSMTRDIEVEWKRDDPAGDGVILVDDGNWSKVWP